MSREPPNNAPPSRRKPGQGLHTRVVPGKRQGPPELDEWAEDARCLWAPRRGGKATPQVDRSKVRQPPRVDQCIIDELADFEPRAEDSRLTGVRIERPLTWPEIHERMRQLVAEHMPKEAPPPLRSFEDPLGLMHDRVHRDPPGARAAVSTSRPTPVPNGRSIFETKVFQDQTKKGTKP